MKTLTNFADGNYRQRHENRLEKAHHQSFRSINFSLGGLVVLDRLLSQNLRKSEENDTKKGNEQGADVIDREFLSHDKPTSNRGENRVEEEENHGG